MSIRASYQKYEDAFEETFSDDDWSRVERCFAENAVHESDPVATGRGKIPSADAVERRSMLQHVECLVGQGVLQETSPGRWVAASLSNR